MLGQSDLISGHQVTKEVCPPLKAKHLATFCGMLSTSRFNVDLGMLAHAAWSCAVSSVTLVDGGAESSSCFKIPQRFSTGLRSGEFQGQMPFSKNPGTYNRHHSCVPTFRSERWCAIFHVKIGRNLPGTIFVSRTEPPFAEQFRDATVHHGRVPGSLRVPSKGAPNSSRNSP